MSNHQSITGRLGDDVELRFTPNGKAVANGAIADTPRRLNRDTNQWEDAGETLWLRFSLWGAKAEALAEVARKGDLVMATVIELDADEVAVVPAAQRGQGKPQQAAQSDPWGAQQPAQQAWGGGGGDESIPF